MKHTQKDYEKYMLAKPGTFLDYPFGEGVAVYKLGGAEKKDAKMFAIIAEEKQPVNISLKCDPILAKSLREQYESIMPGYHLNKKHWNTIIDSGQLEHDDILGFIDMSYNLVLESLPVGLQDNLNANP